ncbi:class I SAM-dependent methyltransferase [Haliangium ochraceum]|uniref:Methyltransferase type 11 n=1 Tax=Haliangium ochraceum (strain DSM 14365 / JCM 11303 / SMP-2) TaxID=502025 RepID=D0LMJ8_HALO1|nr:class I SAM-dependent methyltransferase [Haliangium ochraceum]ACY18685.1 Methyltransferase type 11 [Haliangium ochraceum DSM 14365]
MSPAQETQQSERDRRYWDQIAQGYDRKVRLFERATEQMLARIADDARGAGRVLEVAAGTGLVTAVLARAADEIVATDYAAAMVAELEQRVQAQGLTNVRCEQADLYALPYEAGSFDAVVASNVLHLVPDLDGAIAALRRVLAPGGSLYAPTFCHAQTWRSRMLSRVMALTGFPGQRRFTGESLADALSAAGLQVRARDIIPGLLPIGYVVATAPS